MVNHTSVFSLLAGVKRIFGLAVLFMAASLGGVIFLMDKGTSI